MFRPLGPTSAVTLCVVLAAGATHATPAEVRGVDVERRDAGYHFAVTLFHEDIGWEDYADAWRVVTEGGDILGTRRLAHPHIHEQPFTRSLSGVTPPDGTSQVFIETSTSAEGWHDGRHQVTLPD